MIDLHKLLLIYFYCCCSFFIPLANAQTKQHTKSSDPQQSATIIILSEDYKKNKNLQTYNGSGFGLNLNYFKKMPESEKAILGYIATYAGTDCDPVQESRGTGFTKYNCRLTLALGLGYQCSAEYLAFERKWFRNDTVVLKDLKNCGVSPSGASHVSAFGEIKLTKSQGSVKIYFQMNTFSIRSMRSAEWTETFYFKVDADQIRLLKHTQTTAKIDQVPDDDTL